MLYNRNSWPKILSMYRTWNWKYADWQKNLIFFQQYKITIKQLPYVIKIGKQTHQCIVNLSHTLITWMFVKRLSQVHAVNTFHISLCSAVLLCIIKLRPQMSIKLSQALNQSIATKLWVFFPFHFHSISLKGQLTQ